MARINLARGLLRLWIVLSLLWVAFVGWLAWDSVRSATIGRRQYAIEFKEGKKPWEMYDGKTMKDVVARPSENRHPLSFTKVEYRYLQGFDASVSKGALVLIDFPDSSLLYIGTFFYKPDQETISRWYWDGRWFRRWEVAQREAWLLPFAVVPPLALMLLGFVVRWIARGFRAA